MYHDNKTYQRDLEEAVRLSLDFKCLYEKSFLITGASGLIASFLIDLLFYANKMMNAEIKVYALVRDRKYAEERYCSILRNPYFRLVVQDVCAPLTLENEVDYIIHAAGDGYPGAFRERPVETMLPALTGTIQLLEYARRVKNIRILYLSSGEVYGAGNAEEFFESDSGYVDPMKSRSCYPSAKRAAETLCGSYFAEYGVDTVVIRPSHVYGPNTSRKDNRASVQFFQDILDGRDVTLKSEGKQRRSYTYMADCVSALLTVLVRGRSGEAYNVSNPGAVATIAQFAQITASLGGQTCTLGKPQKTDIQESTPIAHAVLNSEKLHRLGWTGGYDVPRGIRHTLAILKDQQCKKIQDEMDDIR